MTRVGGPVCLAAEGGDVLQRETSLLRQGPGTTVPRASDFDLPCWSPQARVVLPDTRLLAAVGQARVALAGRATLSIAGELAGAARLAQRLAAQHPDDDRLAKVLGVLRSRVRDGFVVGADGRIDPATTAALGRCEAAQLDPRAWDRVDAFVEHLVRSRQAPVDPRFGAGLLEVLTSLLVGVRPGLLDLMTVLPDDWFGESAKVEGLPVVGAGLVSWSLTWGEDWPRLAWATSAPGRRITSSGLASGWTDARPRGEADLVP